MSLEVLVNGELVKTVEGVVLGFSVNTAEGEKAAVKMPADGYKQVDIVTREISPGGPLHLSQVEEAQRVLNRERGAGLPDPVRRTSKVNLSRQSPGTGTVDVSAVSVEDAAAGKAEKTQEKTESKASK